MKHTVNGLLASKEEAEFEPDQLSQQLAISILHDHVEGREKAVLEYFFPGVVGDRQEPPCELYKGLKTWIADQLGVSVTTICRDTSRVGKSVLALARALESSNYDEEKIPDGIDVSHF
jgi:hypothetical protein